MLFHDIHKTRIFLLLSTHFPPKIIYWDFAVAKSVNKSAFVYCLSIVFHLAKILMISFFLSLSFLSLFLNDISGNRELVESDSCIHYTVIRQLKIA